MNYTRYTPEEKRALLSMLVRLSKADGSKQPVEDRLIELVARKMGINDNELVVVRTAPDIDGAALPKSEADRITFMFHLALLAKADKLLTQEETQYLKQLGFLLGLRPGLVNDIVELILDHINKGIPQERFMDTVKTYLN